MPLQLYNSLTRHKEHFAPQDPQCVRLYNCGPTVYDYAHIGNARAAVTADVLFRLLRHIYGEKAIIYVRNITDIDDKIITHAQTQNSSIAALTDKYATIYNQELTALNCLTPSIQPKASDYIAHMQGMITDLLKKGYAYESDGHVFFDVSQYKDYGQLSGNTLSQLKAAGRVGEAEYARKKNMADFVLWKPSDTSEACWESPFGAGRPGWHIECSAMIQAILGQTIDIHCGGIDLKFPHHENEITQSACVHGQPLARVWVHNEFLNMGHDKMSKSLGNVQLIHDLLQIWDGEVIRLALLKAHYRSLIIWTDELLHESKVQLDGWYRQLENADKAPAISEGFLTALYDDMNTPLALSRVTYPKTELNLLGLLKKTPDAWFKGSFNLEECSEINALVEERRQARQVGNWARSDQIRDQLKACNIILEDGPDSTSWRKL